MTLAEALQVFDETTPALARCCGLAVVMNSQEGTPTISCQKCARTIQLIEMQWMVAKWGTRGFSFRQNPPAADPVATVSEQRWGGLKL
jgi:hypothetical protein